MKLNNSKFIIHNSTLLLFLALTLLLLTSCEQGTNPPSNSKITLTFEDASCTEAWLNLKLDNITLPTKVNIIKNDSTIITANINSNDTTLFVENLLPNQTYSFYSTIPSFQNSAVVKSNKLSVVTMDTTSHNFTWETFILGDDGYNYLNDIAIISENNIWAVGMIHTEDTDKFDSNGVWVKPYNAVHWDGNTWELKRILVDFMGNKILLSLESIIAFSETDIWFGSGLPIHGDGKNWKIYDVREIINSDLSLSKGWGTSSNNIYFIGYGGSIAHYNGSKWTKIESGTENRISDIWGFKNSKTAENEIYFSIAGSKESISKITDFYNVQKVEWGHTNATGSIWGLNEKLLLVAGEGIFRQKGKTWVKEELEKEVLVMDMKGDNYNNIVSVGLNGELNYFNGATWKTHDVFDGNLGAVSIKNNIIATIGIYKNAIIIGKKN